MLSKVQGFETIRAKLLKAIQSSPIADTFPKDGKVFGTARYKSIGEYEQNNDTLGR